ncbi:MAG: PRC-barrel domain containing protein [Steroidobacteraceae bacterium]
MLRSMKSMEDYTIGAIDGIIGQVKDFYFDDESWVIRYLVVQTGEGASRRKVLISPIAIGRPKWAEKVLPAALTRSQVANSPDIDTDKPVSRQHEMGYLGYYGYGSYWGGGGLWGAGLYPDLLQAGLQSNDAGHHHDDLHLRSGNAVMRYYVHASDGDIGHVHGFLVDEDSWAIRYLIVDTSNWWLGHQVLIAPQWIDQVSWAESTVSVGMTRQSIKDSPAYDPNVVLDREQETGIHRHYGRSGYWPREAQHADAGRRL